MIRLATFPVYTAFGHELVRRLRERGIAATVTNATVEGMPCVEAVWIDAGADPRRATCVLRDLESERTDSCCPCGYDLRGHSGRSRCPECGRRAHVGAPDADCPRCGQPGPSDFDVCWSCAAGREPAAA
jgi:hypothetical protein